jgi:hypothetical protein
MATAKKTTAPKGNTKASEVDDILGDGKGAEDVLSGKKAGGKKAKKEAAKKEAPKKAGGKKKATTGGVEEVKAVLLKTKKLTSYQDIADANNFDIRMVRRTARALGDSGEIERVKEGTVVYVKKA